MALLRTEGLTVSVDGNVIISDVTIEVDRGEIAILMGPNGSGKSTLLYTIMGLPRYNIVKGRILFNGVDITGLPPWKRAELGIALAFQNPPKIRIKLGYIANKISERHGTARLGKELMNDLKLLKLVNRDLYHGFSGGEVKRTELYLTILQKPKIALLDEPDSGVDLESIKVIAQHINKLAEEGTGILLVTHQGYILRYIDNLGRGYVMYNGRIIYSGTAYEIYRKIIMHGYTGLARIMGVR